MDPDSACCAPRRFTTVPAEVMDTVTADKTHRGHASIEQVNADLKHSALAHLPSGVFTANAAWLVLAVIAFNLTRAAATLTARRTSQGHHRHDPTQTHQQRHPACIVCPPDHLHLPAGWPWQRQWTALFDSVCGPPATTS